MGARKHWVGIVKVVGGKKKKKTQPETLYLAKLSFKNEGKISK